MPQDTRYSTPDTQFIVGNIGNTSSEFALADMGSRITQQETLPTADLLGGSIPNSLDANPDTPLWVASVVPQSRDLPAFSRANWVSAESCGQILDLSAVDASRVGADRLANCVAAVTALTLPVLIIDCGTAITFELVDSTPSFLGGAILPGRALLRSALNHGTAQLPELPLQVSIPAGPGTTTADAMAIGLDKGIIGAVESVRSHILTEMTEQVRTFVTGGDAGFFLKNLTNVEGVPADFTLRGVAEIALSTGSGERPVFC